MAKKTRNAHMSNESKMVRNLDKLAAFDDYNEKVAPLLQKAVSQKWSAEKIYKEFESLIAAKMITTALTDEDTGKALTAAKEVLDRSLGKPKERVEQTHKYEKLSDDELDNLLKSTLGSIDDGEDQLQ
jgi:ribosome-associated translation inhibitor RaiA